MCFCGGRLIKAKTHTATPLKRGIAHSQAFHSKLTGFQSATTIAASQQPAYICFHHHEGAITKYPP